MARVRVSTTVDGAMLEEARNAIGAPTDAVLFDRALASLLQVYRSSEIDAAYNAYETTPLDEPDEWGDLATFRATAGQL